MRKLTIISAMAMAFVLVGSTMAFAMVNRPGIRYAPGTTNIQRSWRSGAASQITSAGSSSGLLGFTSSAETNVMLSNTYISWGSVESTAGNTGASDSPHGGYSTTSVKCAVCHAVHVAAPGNAPVAGGTQSADTLLRFKANEACSFCHVATNPSVTGTPLYGGNSAASGHTYGHELGSPACRLCHASVHGAGADPAPSIRALILKVSPTMVQSAVTYSKNTTGIVNVADVINLMAFSQGLISSSGTVVGYTATEYNTLTDDAVRQDAVGLFCNQCHDSSYAQTVAGASTNLASSSGPTANGMFSGHRVGATATTNWNSVGATISSAGYTGQVAWAPAEDCRSCHDANNGFTTGGTTGLRSYGFPHYWGTDVPGGTSLGQANVGNGRAWMLVGANAGATKSVPASAGVDGGFQYPRLTDGACLKCHRGGTSSINTTGGVGIDF